MISLHTLPDRFARHLSAIIDNKLLNAGQVILRWNTQAGPTDRNLEQTYPEPVETSLPVNALIHFISERTIDRGFTSFKAGDAIITFDADVDLTQRDLVFLLPPDGAVYVQASAGKDVMQFWDVVIGGNPLTRTLLLRLKA